MENDIGKFSKKTIVYIVLAILVILFVVQTFFAAQTYQKGIAAFEQQNWQQAINDFSSYKKSMVYYLKINDVDQYTEVAQIMAEVEELKNQGNYEGIFDHYGTMRFYHLDFYNSMNIAQIEFDDYFTWVNNLIEAGNYEKAIEVYEQIEGKYANERDFKLDISFDTLYPDLYHEWAAYLRENHNYADASEKYTTLAELFPESKHVQTMETDLQNTVLEWITYLIDIEDLEQAFDQLSFIQKTWPSSEIAEETKQQYIQIGLQSAVLLHEKENYGAEFETLESMTKSFPDADEMDEANEQLQLAYQACSEQCINNGQYLAAIHALEAYRSTIEDEDAIAEIDKKINIAQEAIVSDSGEQNQAMMELIAQAYCTREIDVPSIVNAIPADATKIMLCDSSVDYINSDFLATTLAEMKYVVGIEKATKEIETCDYTNGKTITRYQDFVILKIFDVKTGERINSQNILGEVPEDCPWKYPNDKPIKTIEGAPITNATINGWIKGKLNP